MWIYIIIGLISVYMGLTVHVFKLCFLIAGYNTMPKRKQEKVDTKGLGRLMGIYFYSNGGALILTGALSATNIKIGPVPAIIFFVISTIYLMIKAQSYDGNHYDERGNIPKSTWIKVVYARSIAVHYVKKEEEELKEQIRREQYPRY